MIHAPVMLNEVLRALKPADDEIYVDGTFGAGGYTKAFLDSADCTVIAIDRDRDALARANVLKAQYGERLVFIQGNFGDVEDLLISGEQFGIGGSTSVRGTESERPISGDRGLSATLEVTTPEFLPGLRLAAFADAGWLGNNSPNGTSKPSSDRLAGVGLGLRYGNGPVSITADYGRLVRGSNVPLTINTGSPQKGDEKLYVNMSVRF